MKNKENQALYDRAEDITIEDVKSLRTFKDWDEQKVIRLIKIIKSFTITMYVMCSKNKKMARNLH